MAWRRRNYLINKDFQLRYIGRIIFGIFIMGSMVAFTVYHTTLARIMDQFYNIPAIASQFADLFASINQALAISFLLFIAITAVFSIFISHSIAGPVYRFQKIVQALRDGDFSLRIGLRRGDEFKALALEMNTMIQSLRERFKKQRGLVQECELRLSELAASGVEGENREAQVAQLRKLLAEQLATLNEIKLER